MLGLLWYPHLFGELWSSDPFSCGIGPALKMGKPRFIGHIRFLFCCSLDIIAVYWLHLNRVIGEHIVSPASVIIGYRGSFWLTAGGLHCCILMYWHLKDGTQCSQCLFGYPNASFLLDFHFHCKEWSSRACWQRITPNTCHGGIIVSAHSSLVCSKNNGAICYCHRLVVPGY